MIATHLLKQGIQLVAGPTTGGIILAFEMARQLRVRGICVEKTGATGRDFRRGFTINPDEHVLVVDDILTTGGSIREVMTAVTNQNDLVMGAGFLVDRSEQKIDFGVPFFSCLRSITPTYEPQDYPLCAAQVPLTKPSGSQ